MARVRRSQQTGVRRRRRSESTTPPPAADRPQRRTRRREYTVEWVPIEDITLYEFNPRDNREAIASVAQSIEEFGWMLPCIIDANNVMVAGHTRYAAAQLLGDDEIPCYRVEHLSEEQVKAFRLVDNKVAELAKWDTSLLAQEMRSLNEVFDFTAFGWSQEEVDCLGEVVADDCLSGASVEDAVRGDAPSRTNQGAGPQRTRFTLGQFVFYVPIETYVLWAREIQERHDFIDRDIIDDIRERLGIPEHDTNG